MRAGQRRARAREHLEAVRAEAVKSYLVQHGADADMLVAVGVGSTEPKNAANPTAAENRRVEITIVPVTEQTLNEAKKG